MKKTLIIIQARMGSSRLPGKVLMEIEGKPLLWYMFQRLKRLKSEVEIILATTNSTKDDPLVEFLKNIHIKYYRGSENDVLDRFYQTALSLKPDIIVRITGDCPLIDPSVIDEAISFFQKNNYDYINNTSPPTYPDGYDCEVFTFSTLEKTWKEAKKNSEREHVTPYIYNHKEIFKTGNISYKKDYSSYRLTVDEIQDFQLIKNIITHFKENWINLTMEEVIKFLDANKEIKKVNEQFQRNEGYAKSLKEDEKLESDKK